MNLLPSMVNPFGTTIENFVELSVRDNGKLNHFLAYHFSPIGEMQPTRTNKNENTETGNFKYWGL
jgi:hypothetical protein